MRTGFLVGRLIALPLRHKLIAAGIVVAFIAGYTAWARHLPGQEYTSSALLFLIEARLQSRTRPKLTLTKPRRLNWPNRSSATTSSMPSASILTSFLVRMAQPPNFVPI